MPQSYTRVFIHLTWSTKDRAPVLAGELQATVYRGLHSECEKLGVDVVALGGIEDHVHLLVRLPPAVSLAELMRQCKGSTSHLVNAAVAPERPFRWQNAYRAFSVSPSSVERVKQYIARQREHHDEGTTHREHEPGSASH